MVKNSDFLRCIDERDNESFFKVLQGADISSENMRAIPHGFVRTLSDNDLSRKMKIRAEWGRSWEVEISKNPRFYFMEKAAWEKFVRDNILGDSELLTFTHKGKMRFTLNIFNKDGKEMLQPRQSAPFLASSSRIKTEHGEGVYKDGKKEEVVVSYELSYLGPTTAETNGGGKYKRKLNFWKKKAEESQNSKKAVSVGRDIAGTSSSAVAGFTISIKKSYLTFLAIPQSFTKDHLPEKKTLFKIHHPDMKKSWNVVYLARKAGATFSGGWMSLAKEYPLALGNTCQFTLIKPTELLLVVSNPCYQTHS